MTEHEGTGIDLSLDAFVKLGHKVSDLNATLKEWLRGDVVFQQPLYGQLSASGTLDGGANTSLTPPRGLCWSVRRMSATGFSAGTVTAYLNGLEPVELFTSTTAPQKYPKGAILLYPGDRLTYVAATITGIVLVFGVADAFPVDYLRRYLD